jgi:hypothetical protein
MMTVRLTGYLASCHTRQPSGRVRPYGDDRKHPSRLRADNCGSRYSEFAVPQLGHFRPARI